MADFALALPITLKNEGGFFDRSETSGEVVNMGITLATLRSLGILKSTGLPTAADIEFVRTLSVDDVTPIYRQQYWDKLGLDAFRSQPVANSVFDLDVNSGPGEAVIILQRSVNAVNPRELAVAVDEKLGPQTIYAVNRANPVLLLSAIRAGGIDFYNSIQPASDRPGWIARLTRMTANA